MREDQTVVKLWAQGDGTFHAEVSMDLVPVDVLPDLREDLCTLFAKLWDTAPTRVHVSIQTMIPFDRIRVDASTSQRATLDVSPLVESISKIGLRSPLIVRVSSRKDVTSVDLVHGSRRAHALGPEHLDYGARPVPVLIGEGEDDGEDDAS